jgi:hypothetical protein
MVGFESLTVGAGLLQFKVVASLLPLAMVFRKFGVAGISIGCPLAHLLATGSVESALFAFASAFGGSVSAYLVYRKYGNLVGLFIGTVLISVVWTTVYGFYFSLASSLPVPAALTATLSSLWIGVNVVGLALTIVIRIASRSWDTPYAGN